MTVDDTTASVDDDCGPSRGDSETPTDALGPPVDELSYINEYHRERLSYRQLVDYNEFRRDFHEWLLERGDDPERKNGLAEQTADNYSARVDRIARWVWDREGYTTRFTHEHANAYAEGLADDSIRKDDGDPYAESSKRRALDALVKLFAFLADTRGGDEWEPPVEFSGRRYNHADVFTPDERRRLREAALSVDTIPSYNDLSPDARDRWRATLAQRLGKPKAEVTPDDWARINRSWEIPSLVWTSLDAGFRPIEIERSSLEWLRLDKATLFIPKGDSSKNRDNWEVALEPRTVDALRRWLDEREAYPKYDDSDAIWLNRKGNPHNSGTLNCLLDNLCAEAGIDRENRDLTWYSIRHSLGTHMASAGTLAETKAQLRHRSLDSTLQYVHPSPEDRRDTLDKIG
jgi:site-specific recombinase XerD